MEFVSKSMRVGSSPKKLIELDQQTIVFALFIIFVLSSERLPGFSDIGNIHPMLRSVSVLGIFERSMAVVVISRSIARCMVALDGVNCRAPAARHTIVAGA